MKSIKTQTSIEKAFKCIEEALESIDNVLKNIAEAMHSVETTCQIITKHKFY